MAQIETWVKQDLKKPVKVQYLGGNLFSQDAQANLIGVELTSDGSDYSGGGSVNATVIRADGATVTVAGSLSGKRASVILPAACYAVIGVITIIIKLSAGSDITTVGAFVSSVYASSTGAIVDPGTVIPSIEDLIQAIEDAVGSIPADYSGLWTILAPAYSSSATYQKGQYCTRNSHVLRCIADIETAESYTSDHWWNVGSIGGELWRFNKADDFIRKSLVDANDLTFKDYQIRLALEYGRYLSTGYYNDLLDYARSMHILPAGRYKCRVPSGYSFLPVKYTNKSTGVQLWNSFSTSTGSWTIDGDFILNVKKTDTSSPNMTQAEFDAVERNIILTRISQEETLEDKMNRVLIGSKSENLFNGTFVTGEEVATSNGNFVSNSSFARTNKIKIKSGYTYIGIDTLTEPATVFIHAAFYDRNGNFISGLPYTGISVQNANDLYYQRITAPDDGYIAFDIYAASAGNYNYYLSQTVPTGYKPYQESTYKINPALIDEISENGVIASMTYGSSPSQAKRASMTNGQTITVENNSIIKRQKIVFNAKISGYFDTLLIGHGSGDYGYYLKFEYIIDLIDGVSYPKTKVTFMSNGSSGTSFKHDIPITGFVTIVYEIDAIVSNGAVTNQHTYTVATAGGTFTKTHTANCVTKGAVFAQSSGTSFTDATLTWYCDDYKAPVWIFGDSYFTIYSYKRWTYYMIKWGFDNCLFNAYPGEASPTGYQDLLAALEHGTPKYLVWCLGMNDHDTSSAANADWLEVIGDIETLCSQKGITLIMCTIPQVTNSAYNNQYKNAYITSSGYRYIDFAGAVSGVSDWEDDGVHPNEKGALLLAGTVLKDFPEIMQK